MLIDIPQNEIDALLSLHKRLGLTPANIAPSEKKKKPTKADLRLENVNNLLSKRYK